MVRYPDINPGMYEQDAAPGSLPVDHLVNTVVMHPDLNECGKVLLSLIMSSHLLMFPIW